MRKKSIPCYIANGGEHDVVNIPLGQFTRWRLKLLVHELLRTRQTLETFVAAKATPKNVQLLEALAKILALNLKPKENRAAAITLQSAVEKNLKPKAASADTDETINLVQFSIKCGLIVVCFLVGAFMQQCEGIIY